MNLLKRELNIHALKCKQKTRKEGMTETEDGLTGLAIASR